MLEINKIHQGDTFELLDYVEDESIDLVLTDPPYNISKDSKGNPYGDGRVGIHFGDWDYGFDTERWIEKICSKPKKDKGQILVFNSRKNMEIIARVLENKGYYVQENPLYWIKSNPIPHFPETKPVSAMEKVLWAVRGKDYVYNENTHKEYKNGRFEASSHERQRYRFHTTQKPLSLWERLIKIHSNSGDLILDTFGGSGVTAVAATRLRRNFLVFELDDRYYKLSNKWLKEENNRSKTLWF